MTDGGKKELFFYFSTLIFMGFWVLHPVYLCNFLIQDKVILKSSSLWKSASLDTRISSLLLYISLWGKC